MDTRLNILVVEDNDELREATVEALRLAGHHVLGLGCAEALPEAASWRHIDLMVIDLNLPGEDGLSLCRRIRAAQPEIGIIMVTARDLPADRQAGYVYGADIYMPKPVSLDELIAAITSLSRRLRGGGSAPAVPELTLDIRRQRVCARGLPDIELTRLEVVLLTAFVRAAECRLETWQLTELLGKDHAKDPKAALEIQLARLRKKLVNSGYDSLAINAIRNWGYQLTGIVRLN